MPVNSDLVGGIPNKQETIMPRQKSEFRSSWGKATQVFSALCDEVHLIGGTDEHLRQIETDPKLRRQLAELVVNSYGLLVPELKVWKTIKLGFHRTPDAYRQSNFAQGNRIYQYADQILDKVTVSPTETKINLAVVTVADLGFKRATHYDVICKRIIEIGAQLCLNEVGPALRDQYTDQPFDEYNVIAMEPLIVSVDDLRIFSVSRDIGGRWLDACHGNPGYAWNPGDRFVVAVPRK